LVIILKLPPKSKRVRRKAGDEVSGARRQAWVLPPKLSPCSSFMPQEALLPAGRMPGKPIAEEALPAAKFRRRRHPQRGPPARPCGRPRRQQESASACRLVSWLARPVRLNLVRLSSVIAPPPAPGTRQDTPN